MSVSPENKALRWSPAELGQAIRRARTEKGLSITELARRSELSQSFVSQVEVGGSDISVGRLVRIAQALEMSVADLVEPESGPHGDVVRREEQVQLPTPTEGLRLSLLAGSVFRDKTFAIGLLDVGAVVEPVFTTTGLESFLFVQEGTTSIEFVSGEEVTLERGDSISYMTDDFVRQSNAGEVPCVFLWAFSPRPRRGADEGDSPD
jgi:transcriptional regulator with XRE-family HTH domain